MPKPKKNESKDDFIQRAIRYFIENEGKSQKEAVGKAFGFWKSYGKKKK